MLYKIKRFFKLSVRDQCLFWRCWLLLGKTRLALTLFTFKRLTKMLEHGDVNLEPTIITSAQLSRARALGKMVARAARHTPWDSLCLVQVLVSQMLLAQEGISGHFYLGAASSVKVDQEVDELTAHAWLQCGSEIVSGRLGHENYAALASFSWRCV